MNKILLICIALTSNILNATPNHGVFDEIDQHVFQIGTKRLYEEHGDFLKGKEASRAAYSEVCSILAEKRNEAARVSDDRHRMMPWIDPKREYNAEDFGTARPEEGIVNTYLVRSENVVLLGLLKKKFIKFLNESCVDREPFSLKHGKEILAYSKPKRIDTIEKINNAIDHSVYNFHIHNELDGLYKNLDEKGDLGQFRFSDSTNINGQLVGASRIYALININSNKSIAPKTKWLLEKTPSFMICHAVGENIKLLQEQAFEHWANAMAVNPADEPDVFLKHIACMFWCRTQAMDFIRGSESITKWLVELTARSFERTIVYPEDYVFRLPFAMSIEEFAMDFMTRVRVQPLDFQDSEASVDA